MAQTWQRFVLAVSFLLLVVSGCKSGSQDQSKESVSPLLESTSSKKGAAIHYSTPNWPTLVSQLQPYWHYHWGPVKSDFQPEGIEFVPMVWGNINNSPESPEELKNDFRNREFEYLLVFNEPDNTTQSNLTISDALLQWQQLSQTGIPLVSPATTSYDSEWMSSFIHQATTEGLKIDYLAMHWFSSPNSDNFLTAIDEAYQMYGLPIWVTEFAVADWEMPEGKNRWSENQVIEFMQTVLPELDKRSYVFRYAWFNGQIPEMATSALFNPDQTLTKLGELYRNHSPNINAAPPRYTPYLANPDNNYILNGNFELGKDTGWTLINSRIATFNHTNIEEGYLSVMLQPYQGQIKQTINGLTQASQEKNYTVTFMAQANENALVSLELTNQEWSDNISFSATTYWHTYTYQFSYKYDDGQPLEITFSNWSDETLYLDAIIFIETPQ